MLSLDDIKDNWAVLAAAGAGLVAWGKSAITAESAKRSAAKAHERLDAASSELSDVQASIASLETHVVHMREGIDDIRDTVKALLKQ